MRWTNISFTWFLRNIIKTPSCDSMFILNTSDILANRKFHKFWPGSAKTLMKIEICYMGQMPMQPKVENISWQLYTVEFVV